LKYRITQVSSLRSKYYTWYDQPSKLQITLKFKKSTLIIILLLAALLLQHWYYSHKAHAMNISQPAHILDTSNPTNILKPVKPLQSYVQPATQSFADLSVQTITLTQTTPSDCGNDPYMAFIYMHESGCRTDAINSLGACGLGQALPCEKMNCSLSDWSCQDSFFKAYAVSRYGSIYNAYLAWQAQLWW